MIRIFFLFSIVTNLYVNGYGQPIIFLENEKLSQLRTASSDDQSHHGQAFKSLVNRVQSGNLNVYGNNPNHYARSYLAQETAFLSLMSLEKSEQIKYADQAFEIIKEIYENPQQERLPQQGYGLSRSMMQLGLALPYAWSRQLWNADKRTYVEKKIKEALDAWLDYDHANFGNERGSNWVAVCRGGELTLMIAANQQGERKERYNFLIGQLQMHMQNGYGSLGVSQEGMGYIEYGVTFLLKAVYAAASIGDSTLYAEAKKHEWWRLAMYAESFQPYSRKFLMTGVAGSSAYNEGFASLLLNLVPTNQLPYYTWWYDRHMGTKAPYSAAEKFDNHRAGTIWSIIYYPLQHTSLDPTGNYSIAVADDHGYYFFRNRWQDENDILLSLMADSHHHGNAWDQPEVFCLNLMGYNNRYFGGPGKDRENRLYSTLLVNDHYNLENAVKLTGETDQWQVNKNVAELVINGNYLYKSLGTEFTQRHLAVKFLPGNQMLMVMLDTIKSAERNKYTWQGNLGDNTGNDSLKLDVVSTSKDLIQVKINGRNQAELNGWFLHENATLENSEDPLRISFSGKNASLLSIFWLGQQTVPLLKKEARKSGIHFVIGDQKIVYDQLNNEIRIK